MRDQAQGAERAELEDKNDFHRRLAGQIVSMMLPYTPVDAFAVLALAERFLKLKAPREPPLPPGAHGNFDRLR